MELQDTLRTLLYSRGRFQVNCVHRTGEFKLKIASTCMARTGEVASAVWYTLQLRTLADVYSCWMSSALCMVYSTVEQEPGVVPAACTGLCGNC